MITCVISLYLPPTVIDRFKRTKVVMEVVIDRKITLIGKLIMNHDRR